MYAANTAAAWRSQGHDVLVLCQERATDGLRFIDEAGSFSSDNASMDMQPTGVPPATGRVRVCAPDIGAVLPVYVFDEYAGFTAKLFTDLSDLELENYTQRNVDALVTAIKGFAPDVIITGHEVMGPSIARRACEMTGSRFIAKLHGSALEYAVKKQDRYLEHASWGLGGAHRVVGGSEYMVTEASRVIPGWRERAVVVNPGCDVELFMPIERPPGPLVIGFVGKLIASKGVHNLLAALTCTRTQELKVVVVGYGGFETELRDLWSALALGDRERALAIAVAGDGEPLDHLVTFLEAASDDDIAGAQEIDLEFTGRLEHGPLSKLLPTFDVLVVPSVLPEAFGMVAAEGAASGVLPIVPGHSGIGEVGAAIEATIGRPGLVTFDPGDPIVDLARAIDRVLGLSPGEKSAAEAAAVALAHERWSWFHVADSLLAAAQG